MTASGVEGPPIQEFRRTKDRQEVKKGGEPFPSKKAMTVNVALFKLKSTAKNNVAPKNNVPYEKLQRKLTLKEIQARKYQFLDSDVSGIFDDLLEANLIDLPEMKRPKKAERKDNPKYYKYHRLDSAATNLVSTKCGPLDGKKASYNTTHTINKDSLLEKKDSSNNNESGYAREQKVNKILIDGGSAVNILPLRILKKLEIPMDELLNSRLMIQGFNQGGQRAIGVIRTELLMDDMVSTALFQVTDAKTSYNILLGRPWLHENSVVPSTWHQCFKYCRNGTVGKVLGDSKPFTKAESHFADAKYYIEDATKEKEVLLPEKPKSYNSQSARKNDSSAIEVELLKGLTLPLAQINMKQPSKPPLKGFVPSTQEEEGGHEALVIDEKKFDHKAFKLLIKAGYNPKEKLSLGKLPPEATGKKFHGLNATQGQQQLCRGRVSSTEDDKRKENPRESVFNRLGPHRRTVHGTSSKQSVLDRPGLYKKVVYPKKGMFKVAARTKKNIKSSHTQKLKSLIPSRMRRRTILAISCGKVLKVKAQIMIFTQALYDEDDRKSVALSNYISSSDSSHDEQYIVKEAYTNGTCRMIAEDGLKFGPINGKFLKR
ncbi:UNVERIFIED_CONTAM: hypothetical protein Slati_1499700 [Sesamum latifolium]|uniref:G-patch domain-containing protein n=1 Tax=Sesamum latifolium TaxID=2727402 RepID=A0AAW2X6H1_9LAMI